MEGTLVGAVPKGRQLSLNGQVMRDGVRQASACSDGPILCYAKECSFTFAALSSTRLLISWQFHLGAAVSEPLVFVIPPVITSHLCGATAQSTETVVLLMKGNDVCLSTRDRAGSYELRWRSELHTFPAPPEMGTLLTHPDTVVRLNYLEFADAIHQAVAQLGDLESERYIHRTKLAIVLDLVNEHLAVEGQVIQPRATNRYYFDPRLVVRALEYIHAEQVEVGLTKLDARRAALSMVDRQPRYTTHCALLSIGLDTQRLYASFGLPQ
jgi:hypothetical protein